MRWGGGGWEVVKGISVIAYSNQKDKVDTNNHSCLLQKPPKKVKLVNNNLIIGSKGT